MTKEKDNLILDFNSILDDFKKLDELTKPEILPLGIIATIKKNNNWYSKDLAFLSNEEVIEWVLQIFPLINREEVEKNKLSERSVRLSLYEQILKFYEVPFLASSATAVLNKPK